MGPTLEDVYCSVFIFLQRGIKPNYLVYNCKYRVKIASISRASNKASHVGNLVESRYQSLQSVKFNNKYVYPHVSYEICRDLCQDIMNNWIHHRNRKMAKVTGSVSSEGKAQGRCRWGRTGWKDGRKFLLLPQLLTEFVSKCDLPVKDRLKTY